MAYYLLNTSSGNVYFNTSVTNPNQAIKAFISSVAKGNITGVKPGVTVRSITPINQQAYSSGLSKIGVPSTALPGASSKTSMTTATPSSSTGVSSIDQVMKQLQSVEKTILGMQSGRPSMVSERERLRGEAGIPELQGQLSPLAESAGNIVNKIKGLPEELKTRFQEFLIPEQFRSRKETVETEGLTSQLETITGQEKLLRDTISAAEKEVTDVLNLSSKDYESKIKTLSTARSFLKDFLNELQQERSFYTAQANRNAGKSAGDEKKRLADLAKKNLSSAKSNLLDYWDQLEVNTNITDQSLTNLLRSRAKQLSAKYPKSATGINDYTNSLIKSARTKPKKAETQQLTISNTPSTKKWYEFWKK